MKNWLFVTVFLLLLAGTSWAEPACHPPKIPKNPTAYELMKAWFDIKFTRFAHDVTYKDIELIMIDKSGFKRIRKAARYRIILHGKRGFYYKDLVVITYPGYEKGLAVLTWSYLDVNKQNDVWLWLPAWKKVRRISQADEDDSFLGTEFTVEDITTRRYGYETYKLIGEDVFPGYKSGLDGKVYDKGVPCYKVECHPKKKHWYYIKRVVWINKKTSVAIYDEYYDKRGKKFKEIFRCETYPENGCYYPLFWEVYNFRTGHRDIVVIGAAKKPAFNTGLSERFFTEKTLERQEW